MLHVPPAVEAVKEDMQNPSKSNAVFPVPSLSAPSLCRKTTRKDARCTCRSRTGSLEPDIRDASAMQQSKLAGLHVVVYRVRPNWFGAV